LYLFYVSEDVRSEFKAIELTTDGVAIAPNAKPAPVPINNNNAPYLYTLCHFVRGDKNYIIFSQLQENLRIASSTNGVLGPYTIHPDILVPGDYFSANLVKDYMDPDNDVLVFAKIQHPYGVYAGNLLWAPNGQIFVDFVPPNTTLVY